MTLDEPTLPAVARGDRDAVAECLSRHGGLVWSLARRLCRAPGEVEDAVQEIFMDLWKNASRFDPSKGTEPTFVATLARRRLIDRARRHRRRPTPAPLPESLADPLPCPATLAERGDDARRAAEALAMLREPERVVLSLSIGRGLTYEEISRSTGMPLGTVKTHARRGLISLRGRLDAPARPASKGVPR